MFIRLGEYTPNVIAMNSSSQRFVRAIACAHGCGVERIATILDNFDRVRGELVIHLRAALREAQRDR